MTLHISGFELLFFAAISDCLDLLLQGTCLLFTRIRSTIAALAFYNHFKGWDDMINWYNIPVSNIKLGTAVKVISTTTFKYWLAIQYRTAHVLFKQNSQQQIQRGPFSLVAEGNLVLPLSLSRHEPVVRQTHWGSRPGTVGHVMCQSGGLRWRAGPVLIDGLYRAIWQTRVL